MAGTAPSASLLYTQRDRIEEIINKSVGVFLPATDPIWRESIVTSQGIGPVGDFGRDFKILKVFQGSLAGVIRPGGANADFTLYGDNQVTSMGEKLFFQGLSSTWPDATQGPNAKPYRLGVGMRSNETNLMMTLGELQTEALDAFIGQILAPKLEGFARNISQFLCNAFYTSQNQQYALATLAGGSGTGWDKTVDSNKTLMVDLTYDNYAVDRFMVGQRVDIYEAITAGVSGMDGGASTGGTKREHGSYAGTSQFIVKRIDELSGKIYLGLYETAGLTVQDVNGISFANGDIIVPAGIKGSSSTAFADNVNNYFTGIAGIRSWMKFGDAYGYQTEANTLLGAEYDNSNYINVNLHPEFKSFRVNNQGAALTEQQLRRTLSRWHTAKKKYGKSIDTLIWSDGVQLAYEQQKIGREIIDRTGRLSNMNNQGSAEGFTMTMDGRSYDFKTSTYIEKGVVYGIKTGGNNWKRYVPPDPRGVRKFEKAEAWIPFRFVASALTGLGTNQLPIFKTDGATGLVTEGSQMPGMFRMQLVPDQPDGLCIENVGEDRIYTNLS